MIERRCGANAAGICCSTNVGSTGGGGLSSLSGRPGSGVERGRLCEGSKEGGGVFCGSERRREPDGVKEGGGVSFLGMEDPACYSSSPSVLSE